REAADPVFLVAGRRQGDHRDAGGGVVEGAADLEAVRTRWRRDVEQQQVGREPLHDGARAGAVAAGLHDNTFGLRPVAQGAGGRRVVSVEQDALVHARPPLVGRVTSPSVPTPTSLRTSICPPWLTTIRFAIGSPRPLPLVDTLRPR